MEELHPYTLARKDPAPETPEQYHNLVMRPQVVGATCLSINECVRPQHFTLLSQLLTRPPCAGQCSSAAPSTTASSMRPRK